MKLVKINRENLIDVRVQAKLNDQFYKITVVRDKLNNIDFPTEFSIKGSRAWQFDWSRSVEAYSEEDFYCIISDKVLVAIFCFSDYRRKFSNYAEFEGSSYLHLFEVNPEYRRQGYGTKSLLMFEEYIKTRENINHISLEHVDDASYAFYQSCGYEWSESRFHKQLV